MCWRAVGPGSPRSTGQHPKNVSRICRPNVERVWTKAFEGNAGKDGEHRDPMGLVHAGDSITGGRQDGVYVTMGL